MRLIEPTMEYGQQIWAYRKEFLDCGDSLAGAGPLRIFENPQDWILYSASQKEPLTVSEGRVPATQYMLIRDEDQKVVGMTQIRHCFNNYLERYGGHIGYSVAPSQLPRAKAPGLVE